MLWSYCGWGVHPFSEAGVFTPSDWGVQGGGIASARLSPPWLSANQHEYPPWEERLGFSSPSICFRTFSSRWGGPPPTCRTPGLSCSVVAQLAHTQGRESTHADLLFPLRRPGPSQGHGSCLDACDIFRPIQLHGVLSWNFDYIGVLLLVSSYFHENCYTHRCIFNVFVGGDKFYILLLGHLDPRFMIFIIFK